jgi:hypothetical protein
VNIVLRPGSITFYPKEPRLFVLTEPSILRDLERRMTRVQYASRSMVRIRTGTLFSTIRKQPGVNARYPYVDVVAGGRGARYVMYEHDGTVPHIIRARRRKMLRFVWHGQVVFRRQVRHPGTTGTFFLTRALPLAAE